MIRILRRVAWRIVRLVAAFVVVWAAGVALERLRAWLDELGPKAAWRQPVTHGRFATNRGDLDDCTRPGHHHGLSLEEAWDAHDELGIAARARPHEPLADDSPCWLDICVKRGPHNEHRQAPPEPGVVRLTVPPAR